MNPPPKPCRFSGDRASYDACPACGSRLCSVQVNLEDEQEQARQRWVLRQLGA